MQPTKNASPASSTPPQATPGLPPGPLALAREAVAGMKAYTPGLQPTGTAWIKLNTNENPYPASPSVAAAIGARLADPLALRRYPNPTSQPLRAAIAAHHGLQPTQVLVGNGCDDILNLLMRAFTDGERPAAMLSPSYSLYRTLATMQGTPLISVPLDASMRLPIEAVLATQAHVLFLTCPNAPTGVAFTPDELAALAARWPGLLVVDETYAPFADHNAVGLLAQHPRLVVTRSFSKAYSLAGLRVGYALAAPETIDLLDRVRDSYNVDGLAQVGALAALQDATWWATTRAAILATRAEMETFYRDELRWHAFPSAANFHFVRPEKGPTGRHGPAVAADLYTYLEAHRVLVRHFPNPDFTGAYLRISLGTPSEMATVRHHLHTWVASP